MRYLVAVDGGIVSEAAFRSACAALQSKDDIILVHIVPDMLKKYAMSALDQAPTISVMTNEAQENINERGKKLLNTYIKRAKELGAQQVRGVLGVSTHEGEFICRLASNRDVDFIYLGRRGLNNFSRFFMGSTSKYVMENSDTNVCIIRQPKEEALSAGANANAGAAPLERAYSGEAIDLPHHP
jgi:nucleotide-binding universal stress UspA family protein